MNIDEEEDATKLPALRTTFCIAAGGDIEKRLTGGNDEKKCDYKIIEKFLRKSQAPNRS